jgi:hypothetical protein
MVAKRRHPPILYRPPVKLAIKSLEIATMDYDYDAMAGTRLPLKCSRSAHSYRERNF